MEGEGEKPTRPRLNRTQKRALKAAEVRQFLIQYGRKAQKGVDPNDRRFDKGIERDVARMNPEALDRLLRDDED
jgi:hypothetical protein